MVTKKVLNDICWKAMSKGAIALYPEELMRLAVHVVRTSQKHIFLNDVQKNILAGRVAELSREKAGEAKWQSNQYAITIA
ncbi:hypothetical protein [Caproicibacterium amylolyticum]|uniref:Uncharacterized protein n=1 Tax=Caproicibacterium amylolyticum TaxID=2766537 RepID=A0A7G9WJT9_9FIRM|nr:hypothetical protein [Caproicibacterium amylolyticum]QNO18951.1 hypothetical protein H6X83_04815 [Caproicibacterium amylolyticum]